MYGSPEISHLRQRIGMKKMKRMLGRIIFAVLVIKVDTELSEIRFTKSVFEKSSSSVTTKYSTSLTDIKSKYRCAAACSSDDLCTRFEFCSDKCTLYQSGSTCHEENNEKTNAGCKCFRMKWLKYDDETCRCPVGYYGNGDQCCQHVIQDCTDGYNSFDALKNRSYVITSIKPVLYPKESFEVLCYFDWGGFTMIQKRKKLYQSTDFNKNWIEYRSGFGTLHGNFWLGLEKMYHILQNNSPNGFYLHLHLFDTIYSQCTWDVRQFNIEDESSNFTAIFQSTKLLNDEWCDGMFSSLSPDSRPFSTYDHVSYPNNFNCTGREESGWWFVDDVNCSFSNLNSKRIDGEIAIKTANGTVRAKQVFMQIKRV